MTNNDPVFKRKLELVAALRWSDRLGLSEGICNHYSAVHPTNPDLFLLNPQGIHWSEVQVSDILTVDVDGNVVQGKHTIEPSAFYIHSRIHSNNPSAVCVLHTHMPNATALCCIEEGKLEWCSQNALRYYGDVAYDREFNGVANANEEGDRLATALGNRRVIFLEHHGVIVTGSCIAYAFDDLYYLERTCELQLKAMSSGRPLKIISDEMAEATCKEIEAVCREQSISHMEAICRMLIADDPRLVE